MGVCVGGGDLKKERKKEWEENRRKGRGILSRRIFYVKGNADSQLSAFQHALDDPCNVINERYRHACRCVDDVLLQCLPA